MQRRFVNSWLALGLAASLILGAIAISFAQVAEEYEEYASAIFFPSVHDGAVIGDTGPWYSNVTVQNIEESRVYVEFSNYVGGDVVRTAYLQPYASTTFTAAQLLDGATTGPVVATAYWAPQDGEPLPCEVTENGESRDTAFVQRGTTPADSFEAPGDVVSIVSVTQGSTTFQAGTDYTTTTADNSGSITWLTTGNAPASGSTYLVNYTYMADSEVIDCTREPAIAGYAKQAAGEPMTGNSRTNSAHHSIDGYAALPVADVAWGPQTEFSNFGLSILGLPLGALVDFNWDGHSYLPIIQNNDGWDTVINVSNVDGTDTADNASVTVRTYRSGGPGQAGQSDGNISFNLGRGETRTISLADLGIYEDGYTGGVWIESDYAVVATAERHKSGTNMLVINQSAPSLFDNTVDRVPSGVPGGIGSGFPELYEAHAPLVFSGYHGWNSGFSVVNIAEITNTVSVEVRNEAGMTVFADQLTIQPKSQQFIYIPHVNDLGVAGHEFIGSALFSSPLPFHASVDQVKYETGEAMSYIATQAGAVNLFTRPSLNGLDFLGAAAPQPRFDNVSKLAFPIIQKGTNDGSGDTSGIQLFNGNMGGLFGGHINARVIFVSGSGAAAPPTTSYGAGLPVNLGERENATVYTLNLSQMDQNATLSAIATVVGGQGVLYGVTNNVNYDVSGDGSTGFNGFNSYGQFRSWFGFAEGLPDSDPISTPTPPDGDNVPGTPGPTGVPGQI